MSKELEYFVTTGLKTFLCTNCGKILRGKMSITLILKDDYGVPIEDHEIENLDTRSNSFTCTNCGQKYGMVEVDSEIVHIISDLNKKGFITRFSCQGHTVKTTMSRLITEDYCTSYYSIPKHVHSNPYVAFDIGAIAKNVTDTLVANKSKFNIHSNLDLEKFMKVPKSTEDIIWKWDSSPIHGGECLMLSCTLEDSDDRLPDAEYDAKCLKADEYLRVWAKNLPNLYNIEELEAWINER